MAGFYGRTGIEFTGDLLENLERLQTEVRPAAIAAVTQAAEIIQAKAYAYANVSAGVQGHGVNGEHMRDEIKIETREYPVSVSARIGIDMSVIPYAAHQEFGPRGNRFLTRAVDESRDECHAVLREVFSASLGADGKIRTAVRLRRIS